MLAAPDLSSWVGRRDGTMLLLAVQTGLRVSELIGLRCEDLVLGTGAHVHCEGKGRKHRCTPLRPETVKVLETWLRERRGRPEDPLFVSTRGGKLSRDAIERLVTKYAAAAGVGVTADPTAEWTAQQLREAFPWETAPHYLLRDRDRIFGADFVKQVKAMGIKQVLSAPRSPWQRAYMERVIGTIRRSAWIT